MMFQGQGHLLKPKDIDELGFICIPLADVVAG